MRGILRKILGAKFENEILSVLGLHHNNMRFVRDTFDYRGV